MKKDNAAKLKSSGYKVTPARLFILGMFSEKCKPIRAEDIVAASRRSKKTTIDLVTVYRTLNSFEKSGLIKRVDVRRDSAYYELNLTHHHHIVCTSCGKTEGFVLCNIETFSDKVVRASSHFKKINDHALELFGVCTTCAKV